MAVLWVVVARLEVIVCNRAAVHGGRGGGRNRAVVPGCERGRAGGAWAPEMWEELTATIGGGGEKSRRAGGVSLWRCSGLVVAVVLRGGRARSGRGGHWRVMGCSMLVELTGDSLGTVEMEAVAFD